MRSSWRSLPGIGGAGRGSCPSGCAQNACYAPPALPDDTTPIATFESLQGASDAAEELRASSIKCAVVDPLPSSSALFGTTLGSGYALVVAVEDKARAIEVLEHREA
jgi:hypothetical protein